MSRRRLIIGNLALDGDLILSPMVGYSDLPYRRICREMGSALNYVPLVVDEVVIQRARRGLLPIQGGVGEHPLAIQILSKDPQRLVRAAEILMAYEPDLFDLNLGCPAKRVVHHGRGAALLRTPEKIAELVRSLVQAIAVPVMAKIRLGWDESSRNHLEVARVLRDSGVSALAVHGRTWAQGYGGKADWEAIAEIRQIVDLPLLANGDVRCAADIAAIRATTGCDGILIGRGAIGNPWIFAGRDVWDIPYAERLRVIRQHLDAMVAHHGPHVGVILFRKHVVCYIQHLDGAAEWRRRLVTCETAEGLWQALQAWQSPAIGEAYGGPNGQADTC